MLTVEGLRVRYGAVTGLQDVSLHVDAGESVAVLGANGAGKSSLVSCVAGVIQPRGGRVELLGRDTTGWAPERIHRLGISLVPEGRRIWGSLTVEENIRLGAMTRRRAGSTTVVDEMLTRFPVLGTMRSRQAGLLSGGQQQQLAIARALVSHPKFLLLDEPTLGLAPAIVDDVFALLQDLREEGLTILLVEQHAERAATFCDRSYVLKNGRVVLEGSSSNMVGIDDLASAYLS